MNSTSVITFTPDLTQPSNIPYTLRSPPYSSQANSRSNNSITKVRKSQLDIEYYSYTDYDIDILLRPGTIMHTMLSLPIE